MTSTQHDTDDEEDDFFETAGFYSRLNFGTGGVSLPISSKKARGKVRGSYLIPSADVPVEWPTEI